MSPGRTVVTTEGIAPPAVFRSALMRWYRSAGRHDLPWRLTRDPYAILVSEVMLQQTQVERALPYYQSWLERWPTTNDLAEASTAEVITAWGGLGYNRRAVNLQRASSLIAAAGQGFPSEPGSLMALPGIGMYTASAVASFAFERREAVADTNIARVLARVAHGVASQRGVPPAQVTATARTLLPTRNARSHNLALMDLGALVCTAHKPACCDCPVRAACAWRKAAYPAESRSAPPVPRFAGTARFARGRIIDALRNAESLSTDQLRDMLPAEHHARVPAYLAALQSDGILSETLDGLWQLPVSTAG